MLLALIINIHGIANATIMPGLPPGGLNQILAPLSFSFFFTTLTVFLLLRQRIIFQNAIILLLVALNIVVMVVTSSGFLPVFAGTNPIRFLRDVNYLLLVVCVMLWLTEGHRAGVISLRLAAKTLVLVAGVAMPVLGFILVAPVDGRFIGFVHTPTMMANTALFVFLIAVFSRCGAGYVALCGAVTFLVIVMCGTRAAFALFLLFGIVAFLASFSSSRRLFLVAPIVLVGAAVAYWLFGEGLLVNVQTGAGMGARVVSAEDIEGGSIASRLVWISVLWENLKESRFVGGFGAGEAERTIGLLPHFDVLRFWYDYSIVFIIVLVVILFGGLTRYWDSAKRSISEWLYVSYMLLLILILSTHNIFQDTATSILMATTLVACGRYLQSMKHRPVLFRPADIALARA
ncbi:MAG: hypothetical protein R6V60_10025 [Desulfobacterales bacterium]